MNRFSSDIFFQLFTNDFSLPDFICLFLYLINIYLSPLLIFFFFSNSEILKIPLTSINTKISIINRLRPFPASNLSQFFFFLLIYLFAFLLSYPVVFFLFFFFFFTFSTEVVGSLSLLVTTDALHNLIL